MWQIEILFSICFLYNRFPLCRVPIEKKWSIFLRIKSSSGWGGRGCLFCSSMWGCELGVSVASEPRPAYIGGLFPVCSEGDGGLSRRIPRGSATHTFNQDFSVWGCVAIYLDIWDSPYPAQRCAGRVRRKLPGPNDDFAVFKTTPPSWSWGASDAHAPSL